jgi:hypothetical protein
MWEAEGYVEDGLFGSVTYTPEYNRMLDAERAQADFLLECIGDGFATGATNGAYTFVLNGHTQPDVPSDRSFYSISMNPTTPQVQQVKVAIAKPQQTLTQPEVVTTMTEAPTADEPAPEEEGAPETEAEPAPTEETEAPAETEAPQV